MYFPDPDRTICIRLGPGDLDETATLEAACFTLPWSREQLAAAFGQPHFAAFGLRADAPEPRLAAYISVYHSPAELEILNLAVAPAWRRRGYAARLLKTALRFAANKKIARAVLEVREGNTAARALYAGFGFREAGRRPGYYGAGGEDALVLEAFPRKG